MSRPQQQTSTWPFLIVLAGLFVLSVAAPRSWQRIALTKRPPDKDSAHKTAAQPPQVEPGAEPTRERPPVRETRLREPIEVLMAADEPSVESEPLLETPERIESKTGDQGEPLLPTEPQGKVMRRIVAIPASEPETAPLPPLPRERRPRLAEPAGDGPGKTAVSAAPEPIVRERVIPESVESSPVELAPAAPEPAVAKVAAPAAAVPPPGSDGQRAAAPDDLPTRPRARKTTSDRVASRDERRPERPDLRVPQRAESDRREERPKRIEPVRGFWEEPEALLINLERLSLDCEATEWATRSIELIRELCRQQDPTAPRARAILSELDELVSSDHPQLTALPSSPSAAPWRRIVHALSRRLEIWQLAPSVARISRDLRHPAAAEHARLSDCLTEVAALTEGDPAGASWRQYLQLEMLHAMAARRLHADAERDLAQHVIDKLESADFDRRQRRFIASTPLAALDAELHHWVAEPVDARQLISTLERFESSYLPSDAESLSRAVERLADWPGNVGRQAHAWLEENYRNANLRISVSEELLNRLIPRQDPIEAPVRDRILGVPTRGWSTTTADLGIRLIPDPYRVRLALEVQGLVSARTTSRSGPATFYSRSDAEYLASKEIAVGLAGVLTQPAYADASNNPQLQGVSTDYDNVPLLGLVIESVARVKHAEQESAVRRIARQKVASRVQEELDSTVETRLKTTNALFQNRVLKPLRDLKLDPSVVAMQTSEDRVTVRVRLAAEEQLGGCTPRPLATSDSLASVQIHQSLLNNVCERMQLDGQTFTLPELQQRLAQALGLAPGTFHEEYPADMRITFAERDAVRIRFTSGRIMIAVAIDELKNYPSSWRDFQVRVYYKPVRRGLDLCLVRDGTVQLWSERFGAQPQIALRGIFSRAFSQDRQLNLLDPKLAADPRLAGLEVVQCISTDGWLGLAIGPRRPAQTALRAGRK